jgi:hypothetical protein
MMASTLFSEVKYSPVPFRIDIEQAGKQVVLIILG